MIRIYLIFSLFFFLNTVIDAQDNTVPFGDNPDKGAFATINGVKLYYEVYGKGEPLLLIHGNGGSIKGHSKRIEYFKDKYKVIAVDSRSHGKSEDLGDSLTYRQMALDLNGLLNHLKIDSAFIWGQSDGGILGLLLSIEFPSKVKKAAIYGANIRPDTTAVFNSIAEWVDNTYYNTEDNYQKRLFQLLKFQPQISSEELAKIVAPVLIMSGDRDVIRLEHSLEIFYAIDNSNLFVMPGATHFGAYEKPELFNMVVSNFFEKPFSKKSTVDIFK